MTDVVRAMPYHRKPQNISVVRFEEQYYNQYGFPTLCIAKILLYEEMHFSHAYMYIYKNFHAAMNRVKTF